jgi:hypothetical protein
MKRALRNECMQLWRVRLCEVKLKSSVLASCCLRTRCLSASCDRLTVMSLEMYCTQRNSVMSLEMYCIKRNSVSPRVVAIYMDNPSVCFLSVKKKSNWFGVCRPDFTSRTFNTHTIDNSFPASLRQKIGEIWILLLLHVWVVWLTLLFVNFKLCQSVHHHTIQINLPTRCNNFSSLLLEFVQ